MNLLEGRVSRRLTAAAERVVVHRDQDAIVERLARLSPRHANRRPRWPVAAAAAMVLVASGAYLAGESGEPSTVPTSVPGGDHFVGPVVPNPPEWAGEFVITQAGGSSNLPAALAVLGRADSPPGRVDNPIVVWVGAPMLCGQYEDDGSQEYSMAPASPACVFDGPISSLEWNVNSGVRVAGAVDLAVLEDVARSVHSERLGYPRAFAFAGLPSGYEIVAEPTLVDLRASPGTSSVVAQIENASNYRSPILALLRHGAAASIEQVEVGGAPGWRTQWELAWEPRPGVVLLEIAWSTGDGPPDVTQDQLLELAERVTLVPESEWNELFDPN